MSDDDEENDYDDDDEDDDGDPFLDVMPKHTGIRLL